MVAKVLFIFYLILGLVIGLNVFEIPLLIRPQFLYLH